MAIAMSGQGWGGAGFIIEENKFVLKCFLFITSVKSEQSVVTIQLVPSCDWRTPTLRGEEITGDHSSLRRDEAKLK